MSAAAQRLGTLWRRGAPRGALHTPLGPLLAPSAAAAATAAAATAAAATAAAAAAPQQPCGGLLLRLRPTPLGLTFPSLQNFAALLRTQHSQQQQQQQQTELQQQQQQQQQQQTRKPPFSVCIVGAGPSGLYCAKMLLRLAGSPQQQPLPPPPPQQQQQQQQQQQLEIVVVDLLPTPFGLVRYGVAADKPEVKVVANELQAILQFPGVSFRGNVRLGWDVSLDELRQLFDAVVLAMGPSTTEMSPSMSPGCC
ncbi:mitochondrial NADPH:adrenodoxin oxidoreductase, putative [Eimeria tenella]|uniref:Mitochondrial NADPH:adrenodoxin oxidoreductase, putative n=1 Tax=Eimeria tenella TaxID=5802 RepID=U6KJY3_EIMTE|nr:mitochondrial NADPH:adrenodoxin oxidoreductase, putative [Eimeria tenella]CDJ37116.1 mitochondrial NADPH:adrenodoxin oxidoreductase, putative [Eimeria tenella]|eukprot:XP_013227954.1 mitochondrial NADPH:adrenodoxin oxidoreductase, putative [Eimeria tenella]